MTTRNAAWVIAAGIGVCAAMVGGCAENKEAVVTEKPRPVEKPVTAEVTRSVPVAPVPVTSAPVGGAAAGMMAEERMRADPVAYLRTVAGKASGIQQYRVTFYRQERLGVVPTLRKMEKIAASFRAEPFSVYFKWEDADSEYDQAAFILGQDDDKVVLLPRKGLLGGPGTPGKFDPQAGVTFGKARNPITDFGVGRMMERTLKRIDAAKADGGTVEYRGVQETGQSKRPAHQFAMTFPKSDPYPNKSMDLFIDTQTELPLGVYMRLPNGKLDAMYLYENLDTGVSLTAADFEIAPPAKPPGKSAKKKGES